MFKDKKTGYSNTISTSQAEEDLIALGQITGFNIKSTNGLFNLPIADFGEPFKIPLKDKHGDFCGMSTYYLRKFKIPAGRYGTLKVFSKEEIANMMKNL